MEKKIKSMCVDEKTYKNIVAYARSVGRSASSMLEQYMRHVLKKVSKK